MSTKTGELRTRPDPAKFLITELALSDGTGQAAPNKVKGINALYCKI